MSKTGDATSSLLQRELRATVRSGIFANEAEAFQEAVGALFAAKPQYRLEAGLEMFRSGEVSLARAAEIAGMDSCRFREIWRQRGGCQEIEVDADDLQTQSQIMARRKA